MPTDPLFYVICTLAVLLYGIAKGGFGGPIAVLSVPLMSLVISPGQAAAILLPILVFMDVLVVRAYWGIYDRRALRLMLPAALLGVLVGYLTATRMNDDYMRILIGGVSLWFGLQTLLKISSVASSEHNRWSAAFFGGLAGFTSFSIHSGGPPLTMYLLPKNLDPLLFAGTAGLFFAVINVVKLYPYYLLDQLVVANLSLSLLFMPLAPIGVKAGYWLVKNTRPQIYYRFISFFLVVVGVQLIWTGVNAG